MRAKASRYTVLGALLLVGAGDREAAAAPCIPAFDYAAFGKDSVTVGGNSFTDSYTSGSGAYGGTNIASNGNLGSGIL